MNWKHVRKAEGPEAGGLGLWLLTKWRSARLGLAARGMGRSVPRLALVERITLAPRQTLALVEAEGRRFLVASSAEGAPAFLALDSRRNGSESFSRGRGAKAGASRVRVSW